MNKVNTFVSIVMLMSLAGTSQAEYNDIRLRENLADDLFELRPWLDEQEIIIEMVYTGEIFSNLHGGLNTSGASEYRDLFDMTLTADAEKFGLGPGSIFIYAQLGNGAGITEEHVGDAQTLSNLDSCDFSQISEYWIEQLFFDRQLRIKVGKQDSNVDFVAVDYGGDFIGSSFAVISTIPMPTFCDPGLGVAAFWEPQDWISLGAGYYEGTPKGSTSGLNTAFGKHGGSFTIGELALKTAFGAKKDLPGLDEDITGIGLAQALWSNRMDNVTRETAMAFWG